MAVRIGVVGAAGRMGQMLVREIAGAKQAVFAGGSEAAGHPQLGKDPGELAGTGPTNTRLAAEASAVFATADTVIDFTVPAASVAHAKLAAAARKALVIGTTGFSAADEAAIAEASRACPIVKAPNMSLVVNLLLALTEQVAAKLGPEFDIEIFEIHHNRKIDAPSGTALALGEAAARGRGIDFAANAVRGRDGHTGARKPGTIGFSAARGGNEVGEHRIMFCGGAERLELVHDAKSRAIYAEGAVRAALWVAGKPPGLYSMKDVLGIA
jgi:4-hydroxy-tetrahydrodipicolinate reductase